MELIVYAAPVITQSAAVQKALVDHHVTKSTNAIQIHVLMEDFVCRIEMIIYSDAHVYQGTKFKLK